MLEYLNFFLLCAIFALIFYLYSRIKRYLPILKMAEELIGNLGYETPQSDKKHQKLLECVLTRNSKLYLGKVYTEEQLAKLSEEEVEKLFNNYEAKLSGQMVKSLGKSIINMYSMGDCSALGTRGLVGHILDTGVVTGALREWCRMGMKTRVTVGSYLEIKLDAE